jgi:hypothetical protein
MEEKEKLYLLLAHGFTSLFFGFMIVVSLAFLDFPFQPGKLLAIPVTFAIFTFAFYASARTVSKYLAFTHDDVHFLIRLTTIVGLSLISLDILVGGMKILAFLSNLSYLGVFIVTTRTFLKPNNEPVVLKVSPHVMLFAYSLLKLLKQGVAMLESKWKSIRARLSRRSGQQAA